MMSFDGCPNDRSVSSGHSEKYLDERRREIADFVCMMPTKIFVRMVVDWHGSFRDVSFGSTRAADLEQRVV